jgi:hypothetical protein
MNRRLGPRYTSEEFSSAVESSGLKGALSDADIKVIKRAMKRKRKFVPGEIYSAKGKTGRS